MYNYPYSTYKYGVLKYMNEICNIIDRAINICKINSVTLVKGKQWSVNPPGNREAAGQLRDQKINQVISRIESGRIFMNRVKDGGRKTGRLLFLA